MVAAGSALVLRSVERPDARAVRNDDGNSAHKITGANAGGPRQSPVRACWAARIASVLGLGKKTMSRFESITFSEVESSDLETFYEHQLDPEAIRMAAFVCEDPKDKVAFDAHWDKILNSSQITKRTIVAEGQVAGHISCYPHGENIEVTYWLGREFWGRGLATQALNRMLHLVVDRPIFARAATDNIGSIRVLQKCGFKIIGKNKDFANGRGEDTEEYILRLDLDQANE